MAYSPWSVKDGRQVPSRTGGPDEDCQKQRHRLVLSCSQQQGSRAVSSEIMQVWGVCQCVVLWWSVVSMCVSVLWCGGQHGQWCQCVSVCCVVVVSMVSGVSVAVQCGVCHVQ